ncbi:MAG: glycosyltransferase family 2 protein [Caulobacteraceae bacterium]
MIVLDADSVMSGPAMLRLVRAMQANPELGILQTLVVGRPSESAFTRIFQFGMRHGMRAQTTGSAWWQGSSGPYWGHNAIIRVAPFVDHCALPPIPGQGGPLRGPVLSHDQVEAALMRGAGWHVRVIPDEHGSWEENPTNLPDFIKRDLRWCNGQPAVHPPDVDARPDRHGPVPAGQRHRHVRRRADELRDAAVGPGHRADAPPALISPPAWPSASTPSPCCWASPLAFWACSTSA